LTTILGSKNGIPPLAAVRLQYWALIFSGYNYEINFKPTKPHANANGLSRLPMNASVPGVYIFNISQIHTLPVRAGQLQRVTRQDSQLVQVLRYAQNGWPETVSSELKTNWVRWNKLTVEGGCLVWGVRVVVPGKLRDRILTEVYWSHTGMAKTETFARS